MASLNDIETKVQNIIDILTCKSITGTLPLTLTANAGKLFNWEIYGNADGVGVRTKNLFEITTTSTTISGVTFTVDKTAGTITANGTAVTTVYLNLIINVLSGDYYYSGCALGGSASTYDLYAWDKTINGRPKKWDGETNVDGDYGGTSQEIKVDSEHSMQLTIRIRSGYICNNLVFKPMIRPADTTPEFIPYGYQVPITVSQTGQTYKNYVIYIGDSQLTDGETITKSSTGVDIELFEGENTVSTTLTNKPIMEIKYNGGN